MKKHKAKIRDNWEDLHWNLLDLMTDVHLLECLFDSNPTSKMTDGERERAFRRVYNYIEQHAGDLVQDTCNLLALRGKP